MNRQIKFRIWNNLNLGEKYQFDYLSLSDALSWLRHGDVFNTGNEATAQQFTGLLDKNGKEIYEGDILEELVQNETSKEIGVCKQVLGGWQIFNVKETPICWHGWKQKIIGNIFENAGLLKTL